jgi:ubiquinone/menaquinone biosynthesis C-methylase UbiE
LKNGIAEKIPYSRNYFDHVKITCVLHHVSDIFKSAQEIRRVTKHEGKIIIFVPTGPGFLNLLVKK